MRSWSVRILGIPLAEIRCSDSAGATRIDNTGGEFELAEEPYSDDSDEYYEEEYRGFGFGRSI